MSRRRVVRGPIMPKQWFQHYKALLQDSPRGVEVTDLPVQVDAFTDIGYRPLPEKTAEQIIADNQGRAKR